MSHKSDYKSLLSELDRERLPKHIGIIMDGNGRWAKAHHRPRLLGHRAGAKSTRLAVELAVELKIPCLTTYAFSTENWSRPQSEVDGLMKLIKELLISEVPELHRQNVKLRFIGSPHGVQASLWQEIHQLASVTHENTGLQLNVAFNYGSRTEIIEAFQKVYQKAQQNPQVIEQLDIHNFGDYLYTAGMPDPDLIIRTSGEMRISNFLLWQAAYAEIYVTPLFWPDFDKKQFVIALLDYQNRNRRFGGLQGT